jgi:hypothetical protein
MLFKLSSRWFYFTGKGWVVRRVVLSSNTITSAFSESSIHNLFVSARTARSARLSTLDLGTVRNWACFLDGKKVRPELVRLEIGDDRLSEKLMLAITGMQTYCVYRRVKFQHVHEYLYP